MSKLPPTANRTVDFIKDVQPIFAKTCYGCHGAEKQKSNYRLDARPYAFKGGDIGKPILPGDSAHSPLIHYVAGIHPEITMPPKGDALSAEQVGMIRAWIDQGAKWPADADKVKVVDRNDWWSLKPIVRPELPDVARVKALRVRNPIDAFILAKLAEKHLTPAPQADRRTLIRRVYFDLIGLPPSPNEVAAFVNDPDAGAYEKLVDRLLASPRYGERWARHWLDAVHYGDTHGYDKDKVRPNAWPYRDYVIRALNEDKPYSRFVKEQLAGDVFYPGTADGIVGLGFIAAGPWDFVGQVELREGTIDKAITRNLDRDDMVTVTMNTLVSLTAQCARCHNHKFDPILQEDYYSLQAVFAGIDRGDRAYDADGAFAKRRSATVKQLAELNGKKEQIEKAILLAGGKELAQIDEQLKRSQNTGEERPEYGYHSAISAAQNATKWVQVDLGVSAAIDQIVLIGCHDDFNNIGAGFGFPLRYRVEASDDATFKEGVITLVDHGDADVANPGVRPQALAANGKRGRYVRVTATKLAPRQNDYIFAVAELSVLDARGVNVALEKTVTSLDSIEAPVRWRKSNLVDGYYFGSNPTISPAETAALTARREVILAKKVPAASRQQLATVTQDITSTTGQLQAQGMVYAAVPVKPRPVFLLHRGSEKQPEREMGPGSVSLANVPELPSRFGGPGEAESQRRADLAAWIVDVKNPLAWRSIVNRMWQYHFGRGIVETPNDFGHMGALPTHPELLDWLASEFRDGGEYMRPQSIKSLHRLIVTSATYRQSCANNEKDAEIDGGNQYLWRANRTRLEAEDIRDSVLSVAGKLDLKMGGPGFFDFGFKDDHSPHYAYGEYNPDDAATQRRSVYRLVVRSVPDPFMETLDCADPSQIVARRNETLTPLQALALLNNPFMVRMSEHFAARVENMSGDMAGRIDAACWLAYGRGATELEKRTLVTIAEKYGMASVCRVILNSNEFVFVD